MIFLAEAFTRPTMMYRLAKIGFSQILHLLHLARHQGGADRVHHRADDRRRRRNSTARTSSSTRPTSTRSSCRRRGRPGFRIRAVLAATLSGLFGVYSGFELCEAAAVPGKEEYLDSEKYIVKPRDWNAPGNIIADIAHAQPHPPRSIRRCRRISTRGSSSLATTTSSSTASPTRTAADIDPA